MSPGEIIGAFAFVAFLVWIWAIFSVGGRSDDDTDILDLRECDIIEGDGLYANVVRLDEWRRA